MTAEEEQVLAAVAATLRAGRRVRVDPQAAGRAVTAGIEVSEREQWQLQHGRPVPARITWALDLRELYGPEVDEKVGTWEGNPAGDVDDWEAARAVPRPEQVLLLAELTGMPVGYFYRPVQPGETHGGMWISWRGRRGCEWVPPDVVDDRGVVQRAGQEPAPPASIQLGLFPATAANADAEQQQEPRRSPARRRPAEARPPATPTQPPALIPRTRMSDADREALMARLAEAKQRRDAGRA